MTSTRDARRARSATWLAIFTMACASAPHAQAPGNTVEGDLALRRIEGGSDPSAPPEGTLHPMPPAAVVRPLGSLASCPERASLEDLLDEMSGEAAFGNWRLPLEFEDLLVHHASPDREPPVPDDPGAWIVRQQVELRMQDVDWRTRSRVVGAILGAARRAGLDPVLILAIIEVESGFDPEARSERDALGLMQLRPATLWREAERSGLAGDDPHDPHLNVLAGTLYFQRLVRAFGPNDVALMAYNAGPNRIIGLIREGSIPDRFLEYPRRVRAAEARLRRAMAAACGPVSPGAPGRPSGRCPSSS